MKPETYRKRLLTKSIPQLKEILDDEVSLYVRTKAANWKNEVICYTCDKTFEIKNIQCGHYVSRVYTNTRWYLGNLRPQCYSCNIKKNGNTQEFGARLDREKPGTTQMLNEWKHRPSTESDRLNLIELIFEFKGKLIDKKTLTVDNKKYEKEN